MRIALATALMILVGAAVAAPTAAMGQKRLGKGYSWGRCLLSVDGKTLISGKCGYQILESGGFYIAGPRQVYEGVDYRNRGGFGAGQQSRDYWAVIFREPDGTWTGYGNSNIRATHGDIDYRTLTREGACYVGEADPGRMSDDGVYSGIPVRICLWRR